MSCKLRLQLQEHGSPTASGWPGCLGRTALAEQAGSSAMDAVRDTPCESSPRLKDACCYLYHPQNDLKKQTKNSLSPEKRFWPTQRHMGLQRTPNIPLPYHSPTKAEVIVSAEEITLPSLVPCRVGQWLPGRMNGPASRRGENHICPDPVSSEGNHIHCK